MTIQLPKQLDLLERSTLQALLNFLNTDNPSLEQIWASMDFVWDILGCDNQNINIETLSLFYQHPIWLLNGLFIEQHEDSLLNREFFSDWVAQQNPKRIADFGGGFGSLARMIAVKCPDTQIEVIEPYPHPLAIELGNHYSNLSYQSVLNGEYDILIATDVFEHVIDPLLILEQTSLNLKMGGKYLIANCFLPVIKCHLPCTFHFRYTWKYILKRMNLIAIESVSYGTVFEKTGTVSKDQIENIEKISRLLFPIFERIPLQKIRIFKQLF